MITSIKQFKEQKMLSDVAKPKSGKMHKVLGIDKDKDISDVYTSGKKLAEDLVKKVGKKKAAGMLAFVANINSEDNVFDKALRALDKVVESIGDIETTDENPEMTTTETTDALEKVKRLSDTVLNLLNEQIKNELQSSQIYRGMSTWLDDNGWTGASKYYFKVGAEELTHMDKIYQYIFDRNASVIVPTTETVKQEFDNIKELVTESLNHEMEVTKQWENISETAKSEGDNTTYQFAQWFLNEQIEEENKFRDILDKINLDMPNWKIDELFETL